MMSTYFESLVLQFNEIPFPAEILIREATKYFLFILPLELTIIIETTSLWQTTEMN